MSLVVRDKAVLAVRPDTALLSGDQVLVVAESDGHEQIAAIFDGPAPSAGGTT